jgi:hypothetical protein
MDHTPQETTTMKKFGFASAVFSVLAAALLGLAAPANADLGHHAWVSQMGSPATAPHVDTTVHH